MLCSHHLDQQLLSALPIRLSDLRLHQRPPTNLSPSGSPVVLCEFSQPFCEFSQPFLPISPPSRALSPPSSTLSLSPIFRTPQLSLLPPPAPSHPHSPSFLFIPLTAPGPFTPHAPPYSLTP
eukprot:3602757-Rhodomonas_salina.1